MVISKQVQRCLPASLLGVAVLLFALAPVRPAGGQEPEADYARARAAMVEMIKIETLLSSHLTGIERIDPEILEAMSEVPRHIFVPPALRPYAYGNHPLPVGHDQNLAAPFLVALMTQLAEPKPDHVVLETGTGAGYHAAVLSRLVAEVYSVEVIEPLALTAAATLKSNGYDHVWARIGDGYYGWPAKGPFDSIIVKEALDHVPMPLIEQLKPGGKLIIPLGSEVGGQQLTVVERGENGTLHKRRVLPVRFSFLQGGERT